jgi:hypothetical protein
MPKQAYMALRGPGGCGSRISRQSAHQGDKVVSPTHRPCLPPGISWYSFRKAESTLGTWTCQISQKKSPVTRPGINLGTFRLVAQRLNHYAIPGPRSLYHSLCNYQFLLLVPTTNDHPQASIFHHISRACDIRCQ